MNGLASTGTWLANGGWQTIGLIVLAVLLIAAAAVDVREHRIPNALVVPGAVLGLVVAHLPGGTVSGSLAGIAVGLGMGMPLYLLRAMGAGDVKLMGMVGAFLGAADTLIAMLVVFVVGGVLALTAVARRHAFAQLGANLKEMAVGGLVNTLSGAGVGVGTPQRSVGVQPYGVAIAAGTILYLIVAKGGPFP